MVGGQLVSSVDRQLRCACSARTLRLCCACAVLRCDLRCDAAPMACMPSSASRLCRPRCCRPVGPVGRLTGRPEPRRLGLGHPPLH